MLSTVLRYQLKAIILIGNGAKNLMHYLLALKTSASLQGRSSIAKGQYRDIEHMNKIATDYHILSVVYYLEARSFGFWFYKLDMNR